MKLEGKKKPAPEEKKVEPHVANGTAMEPT
jgi:hypothetical protein